jgi:DNA-binding transcriptional LysR family regulator
MRSAGRVTCGLECVFSANAGRHADTGSTLTQREAGPRRLPVAPSKAFHNTAATMAEPTASQIPGAMRVTFGQVRGFVTVASTGSFTQAAEVLHLSQPALTTRIRQLEEALDLRLFDRNTRSVALSDAGRMLLPIFLRLVGDLEGAVLKAHERSKRANSIIRLACLPSCAATLLPELISRFRAQVPEATFVVEDAINSQIRTLVRDGQVDFGIGAWEGEELDLQFDDLFADNLQAVFPPGHPLGALGQICVSDLTHYPLILINRGSSIRCAVDEAFAAWGISAAPACEVTYMSTAVALVQAGLGVAILPSTAVEVRSEGIETRAVQDRAFVRRLGLVRRKSAALRTVVQRFVDSVMTHSTTPPPRVSEA